MSVKQLISDLLSDWNGYAQINAQQVIETADHTAQQLSLTPETDIVSKKACDAFLELVACEDAIAEILSGELAYLEFVQIFRPKVDGAPAYFDFKILPIDPTHPSQGALLLIKKSEINS